MRTPQQIAAYDQSRTECRQTLEDLVAIDHDHRDTPERFEATCFAAIDRLVEMDSENKGLVGPAVALIGDAIAALRRDRHDRSVVTTAANILITALTDDDVCVLSPMALDAVEALRQVTGGRP